MAFYCQNMLEIALILTEYDPMYEEIAYKFVEHFMWISYAMDRIGEHQDEMWDEQDGFFYDLLRLPDGQAMRLKVRSLVGLLPLCASRCSRGCRTRYPKLMEMIALFRKRHPEIVSHVAPTDEGSSATKDGVCCRSSTSRSWSECSPTCSTRTSFSGPTDSLALALSPGSSVRVSRRGQEYKVQYLPANRIPECSAATPTGGARSGCRQWLLIRALLNLYSFYGNDFKVQCPTGSGST
jgi:hypothetical protein